MNKFILAALLFSMTAANLAFAQPELYPESEYYNESDFYTQTAPIENSTSFNYWNIGVGPLLLIPNIGIGTRQYKGHFGYDLSVNVGSIYYVTSAQIIASALYIPNPKVENHMYYGLGIAGGVVTNHRFNDAVFTVSPDFLIGKMLTNTPNSKTFVEMHLEGPTWGAEKSFSFKGNKRLDFPLVYIKYGMSF